MRSTSEVIRSEDESLPTTEEDRSPKESSLSPTSNDDVPQSLTRTLSVQLTQKVSLVLPMLDHGVVNGIKRVAMDALAADAAFQRGIRMMPTANPNFYVFLAPSEKDGQTKVAAAVWHNIDAAAADPKNDAAADQNKTLLHIAFTKGSPCYSDNFDAFPKTGVRVESCTFGLGKVLCEKAELAAMLKNPLEFYEKNIDNARLSDEFKNELKIAVASPSQFATLFKALLMTGVEDTAAACQTWSKKVDASDPIHLLLPSLMHDVKLFKAAVLDITAEEALEWFGCIKQPLLNALQGMDPRVAKMAIGRCTLFPVMGSRWEGEGRLHMWSVFFTRIFLLCEAGDEAVYTFFMLNVKGIQCEFSDKDNLWAILNKSQSGGGALCDLLLEPKKQEQMKIEALMQSDERQHKLLGMTNGWVAEWLKYRVGFSKTLFSDPNLKIEMEAAEEYLSLIGWDTEFVRIFLPTPSASAFSPRPIACTELMRSTTDKDVGNFLSRFSLRLTAAAAAASAMNVIVAQASEKVAEMMTEDDDELINKKRQRALDTTTAEPPATRHASAGSVE